MSLKAEKGLKQRSREQCKAQRKAGGVCQAPAVEEGLCFFHARPEKPAELGRQGGKTNRHWNPPDGNLSKIPLKSIGDVLQIQNLSNRGTIFATSSTISVSVRSTGSLGIETSSHA